MLLQFYKYQGTGNDFVMIDNRANIFPKRKIDKISFLCDRHFGVGADGIILIENDTTYDFKMTYFNADGSETFCGNGGRCAVAFARQLGIISSKTNFIAYDGPHFATIDNEIISLKMIDVSEIEVKENAVFTNTGTEPLVISNAKGSCGCTVPKWPQEPIAPGETGEISVEYKPAGQSGVQTKFVTITANTTPATTQLTITGDIQAEEAK